MISDLIEIAEGEKLVQGDVREFIDAIPLITHMISPNRKKAKDLNRDESGKIVVDITKLHILEDTDYFRPAALTYIKNKKYCEYYPSKNPSSPYKKFWDEEIRRCLDGYVRESDGEWIPGYFYFYLNYCPILKIVVTGKRNKDGTARAKRVEDFPDFWDGDYAFYHYIEQGEVLGKYGTVLKSRAKGASYKAASMLNRNYFLIKKSKSYAYASEGEYLDTDGILNKADDQFSFINQHAGFSKKLAIKNTLMHRKSGYNKKGDTADYGFRSERIGVTLKNNPDKPRGKRGKVIIWEESGSFPNLIKSWRIADKSVNQDGDVYGYMLAYGTGGDANTLDFSGLEQLFYNSAAYDVYAIQNVFDKNAYKSKCAFFFPNYLNRAGCYDKDGNSDVVKALVRIVRKRLTIQANSDDSADYAQVIAEEPITPQDATMRLEGTEFPVNEIKEYLSEIVPNKERLVAPHYVVDLLWVNRDTVTYKPTFTEMPIRTFPYKSRRIHGAVELYEIPQKSKETAYPPSGRYIGGVDVVDDDTMKTSRISLFSIWIFDLWNDVIVAEWIGRHQKASDNYDIALKLAILYNAELNYENKSKGMFDHFNKKHKLKYLADTPNLMRDMEYIKDTQLIGNRAKGTPPTEQINAFGRRQQAEWMLTPNENRENILGLRTIRSIAYLQEASAWNIEGNFDRVSAANMLFILRADRYKRTETTKHIDVVNEWEEDEFFKGKYEDSINSPIDIEF